MTKTKQAPAPTSSNGADADEMKKRNSTNDSLVSSSSLSSQHSIFAQIEQSISAKLARSRAAANKSSASSSPIVVSSNRMRKPPSGLAERR